ncbi:MAG: FdtA/QdtA family cupin domain-containing protein [Gallionellaceae bacterium]
MRKPTVNDCKVVTLPKINDPRGNLSFIEGGNHIPFDIKRVFYLYDVPTEEGRGAHAHHNLHQFLICLSGSFDVEVDDGIFQATIHLNRPWKGLHIPPMIWAAELNFDPGSVCLVLASDKFDEGDYIREYSDYQKLISEYATDRQSQVLGV